MYFSYLRLLSHHLDILRIPKHFYVQSCSWVSLVENVMVELFDEYIRLILASMFAEDP